MGLKKIKKINKLLMGFTMVELIIVIAIISVLAGIILANVSGFINKSKDAAIKANLSTIMINASVYYDTNGTYDDFCADRSYQTAAQAIISAGGVPVCNLAAGSNDYCACSTEKITPTNVFCVDSTGTKAEVSLSDCNTECPSSGLGQGRCKTSGPFGFLIKFFNWLVAKITGIF